MSEEIQERRRQVAQLHNILSIGGIAKLLYVTPRTIARDLYALGLTDKARRWSKDETQARREAVAAAGYSKSAVALAMEWNVHPRTINDDRRIIRGQQPSKGK